MKEGRARYWFFFQCLTSGNCSAGQSSVAVDDQKVRCSRKGMNKCVGKCLVVENDGILVLRTQYGLYILLYKDAIDLEGFQREKSPQKILH